LVDLIGIEPPTADRAVAARPSNTTTPSVLDAVVPDRWPLSLPVVITAVDLPLRAAKATHSIDAYFDYLNVAVYSWEVKVNALSDRTPVRR